MVKIYSITFVSVFLYQILFSVKAQYICSVNKPLSKCACGQESNNLENIPLFSIDCSRLSVKNSPVQNTLPHLLGRLDLSHNKIDTLNETTKLSSDTLYYLDYSYNRIKTIPEQYFVNLTRLVELNLKHNRITHLNQGLFNGLHKLQVLNLQANKFKSLPASIFNDMTQLQDLTLSYNDIGLFLETVPIKNYVPKNISALYVDNINLKNITPLMFAELTLKKLSLAFNPIQQLPNLALNYLEYLDVSGTNISELTTTNLMYPHLKILKLNRVPYLSKIHAYVLYNLHDLEELYMEHCPRLVEIDPMAFGYLQERNSTNGIKLKIFSVAYSGLKTLSDSFQFIFEDIIEIDLRGNFWHCDCQVKWFRFLKKNVVDIDDTRCVSPDLHANKTVHSLTDTDLQCLEKGNLKNQMYSPIQTWLFPLVGVLAIVVLVLLGLLIYMGPYGQQIYSKVRSIGPESPYSQITIQPNRAENFDTIF